MKIEAKDYVGFLTGNLEELSLSILPLWHPLGFVSCVIKQNENVTLRVHFWPRGERRVKTPDWPIHTHSYFLSSYVLEGSIRDVRYKTIANGQYIAYSVRYFEGGSEICQTAEKVGVASIVDESRRAGESYEVDLDVFHQSIVPFEGSAVTIVALSKFTDCPPLVLGSDAEDKYPYDRTPYDKELFWENVARAVRGTLNKRVN